jgi:DNA adenine methylase
MTSDTKGASVAPLKPPFTYYGGKTSLAKRIVALLPEHEHYVEPFAGGLAVLLAKPQSRMETVNDLDRDLMTFWQVLRDRPDELVAAAALTPHSRAEFTAARDLDGACSDLERARRVWVLLTQSRSSTLRITGWRHYQDPAGSSSSFPRYLRGYVERMPPAALRLRAVTLECRDALDIIARFGRHDDVLLYVDPPYLRSSRNSSGYRHEMGAPDDHARLADALRSCRAAVVLSGYASPLYEDLYDGWHVATLKAFSGNSNTGEGDRTEVLWGNRPFPEPDALLTDSEGAA